MDPRRDSEPDPVRRSALHIASLVCLFGGMFPLAVGVFAVFGAVDTFWVVALLLGLPAFVWGLRTQVRLIRQDRDAEPLGASPDWADSEDPGGRRLRGQAGEVVFDLITSLPAPRFWIVSGGKRPRWAVMALGAVLVVLTLILHFALGQPWGEALKWGSCWEILVIWAAFVVYLVVLALMLSQARMESDAFLSALLRRVGLRSVLGLRVVAFLLFTMLILVLVAVFH